VKFSEIIDQASNLLQRKGRLSYRTLKLEFDLSDEQLAVLAEELIEVQELAIDKDGKMLVWVGAAPVPNSRFRVPNPQPLIVIGINMIETQMDRDSLRHGYLLVCSWTL
jgi:hypothetical protein